jgi:hypothetical protein
MSYLFDDTIDYYSGSKVLYFLDEADVFSP